MRISFVVAYETGAIIRAFAVPDAVWKAGWGDSLRVQFTQ